MVIIDNDDDNTSQFVSMLYVHSTFFQLCQYVSCVEPIQSRELSVPPKDTTRCLRCGDIISVKRHQYYIYIASFVVARERMEFYFNMSDLKSICWICIGELVL